MRLPKTRRTLPAALLRLAPLLCLALAPGAGAAKGVKRGDAQKAIAAVSFLDLGKGAVKVKDITSTDTSATVVAAVRMGFRFERAAAGRWRAAQVRVGDREWEDFDLLARAAGADRLELARAALDSLAAELEERSLAKKKDDDAKKREERRADERREADDGAGKKQKGSKQPAVAKDKKEAGNDALVRGALRVESPATALSPLGKSAVVEAEVEAAFDLVRESGAWRVSSVRLGGAQFANPDALTLSLDAAKAERARAELNSIAQALMTYRRERGSYVVAEAEVVLMDHLNPRYIARVVRIDPWHRPYEYKGANDSFLLRSLGPDGKPDTPDDIVLTDRTPAARSGGGLK